MKKAYQTPVTESYRMGTTTLMTASGDGIQEVDGKLRQRIGDDLKLDVEDDAYGNLSKGGSIWDAWD